jgi:hypothetical protein
MSFGFCAQRLKTRTPAPGAAKEAEVYKTVKGDLLAKHLRRGGSCV